MGFSLSGWFVNIGKRYLVLIIWVTACALLFWTTYNQFKYDPQYFYVHQMLGSWLCMSRASAAVLNLNCGLVLLPMCRTLVTFLRTIQRKTNSGTMSNLLDACKGFHVACAYVICILTVIHISGHMINARNFSKNYNSIYPDVNGVMYKEQNPMIVVVATVPGISGLLMMIILCVVFTTSVKYVRTVNYNLFWYIHRLLPIFYLLLLVHAFRGPIRRQVNLERHFPGCNYNNETDPWPEPIPEAEYHSDLPVVCTEGPVFDYIGCQSWMWICIPCFLYVCDTVIRLIKRTPTVNITDITSIGSDVLEIHFIKENFIARPGQFVYLQCPEVSTFEWHPYSLTTCPSSPSGLCSIHVRAVGDWSGNLFDHFSENSSQDSESEPLEEKYHEFRSFSLSIDGPFSSPLEDITKYRISMFVAGGIGVTPFIAFVNVLRESYMKWKDVDRLCLIWLNKDIGSFHWFTNVIYQLHTTLWEQRPDLLEIHYHCTGRNIHSNIIGTGQEVEEKNMFFLKRLSYGRPVWKQVFRNFSTNKPGETVGVFSCGPRSLAHELKKHCNRKYSTGTRFHFHQECF